MTANISSELYKAIERALDANSAWIARPSPAITEAVARAAMDFFGKRTKRQQMHMVMDGAIAALKAIKNDNGSAP